MHARFNGGPSLRLMLDSGAAHITLDTRASARSAISAVSESHLVGADKLPAKSVQSGIAGTLDLGPLEFRNCLVDMTPHELAEGIDGVIPLSLFGSFLIRLDLPGKALDLAPYPDRGAIQSAGFTPAIQRNGLLFVPAALNDAAEGYVLLDTGACCSAVSRRTARRLTTSPVSAFDLLSVNGEVHGNLIDTGIRVQVAGRSLTADSVVALDLAAFSAFNGVETVGVLGYPALRSSILTVSYRDALVRIEPRSKPGNARGLIAGEEKAGAR